MRRGLAPSRHQASDLIARGLVRVSGSLADKPARLVGDTEPVVIEQDASSFVSRGGAKLEAAIERFSIEVEGRRCLDAGASTGGFTDCLLRRGAALVVCVDVGRGMLHENLRNAPRVVIMERTNVRDLSLRSLGDSGHEPFGVVVADLSFISLATVAPVLVGELAAPDADLVVLVKPQFEVGRATASRGRGVVKDPVERLAALERVAGALISAGATIMGAMASPLLGPAGNAEFLLHAEKRRADPAGVPHAMLDAAVAAAPDSHGSISSTDSSTEGPTVGPP